MKTNKELKNLALQTRIDVMEMLLAAGSGHAAGSLSAADIFTYLFFEKLKHDSTNPQWTERDYFIVSNGHICPVWYSVLARTGYFHVDELKTLRNFGSILQGHPWNKKTPGVFNSSGMLGHSAGQAIGVALGLNLDKKPNHVYCHLSDGEQQEGSLWEAAMSAGEYELDNLTFIIDRNNIQIDGTTEEIMELDAPETPRDELADKYRAFQWNVIEVDGHSFDELRDGLNEDKIVKGKPRMIIAHTVAGKGIEYMEGKWQYHDWRGDNELAKKAIQTLKDKRKALE